MGNLKNISLVIPQRHIQYSRNEALALVVNLKINQEMEVLPGLRIPHILDWTQDGSTERYGLQPRLVWKQCVHFIMLPTDLQIYVRWHALP